MTAHKINRCFFTLVLALLLGAQNASAIDITSVTGDIKSRYKDFSREVRDMVIVQQLSAPGVSARLKLYKKGDLYRLEKKVVSKEIPSGPDGGAALSTLLIYDGHQVWAVRPLAGAEKLPSGSLREMEPYKEWWTCLSDDSAVLEEEAVNGVTCLVIRPDPSAICGCTKIWIDKKTFVLMKEEVVDANGVIVTWVFSDFKKWRGRWDLPYRTDIFENSQLKATYLTSSLEAGVSLPWTLFTVPSGSVPDEGMEPIAEEFPDNDGVF